jgi:hypothetical protein
MKISYTPARSRKIKIPISKMEPVMVKYIPNHALLDKISTNVENRFLGMISQPANSAAG